MILVPKLHVLVTGGSGFIGRHLIALLRAAGHTVHAPRRGESVHVDGPLDAVVNLAGAPILGPPWTAARRRVLRDSRVNTTQALVHSLAARSQRPAVLVSASAIGFYGVRDDQPLDESAAPQPIFQSQLCQDWEIAAEAATQLGIRVVRLRLGVVLGRDGGALPQLALPARWGLAAVMGNGAQGAPWIHLADVLGLIELALHTPTLQGALNAVAPGHVSQAQFTRSLAKVLGRPQWLKVPAFVLRGLLGEMSQLLVDGQHVVPTAALAAGYHFKQPELEQALHNLLD